MTPTVNNLSGPGPTLSWCKSSDVSLPSPDLVLFLDVSPTVARSRGGYGEERYEKEEMQRNVRSIFKILEEEFRNVPATTTSEEAGAKGTNSYGGGSSGVSAGGLRWVTIDADVTVGEVQSQIWDAVEPFVVSPFEAPIGRLWET